MICLSAIVFRRVPAVLSIELGAHAALYTSLNGGSVDTPVDLKAEADTALSYKCSRAPSRGKKTKRAARHAAWYQAARDTIAAAVTAETAEWS